MLPMMLNMGGILMDQIFRKISTDSLFLFSCVYCVECIFFFFGNFSSVHYFNNSGTEFYCLLACLSVAELRNAMYTVIQK